MSNQIQPVADYTSKDYASLRESMLELAREKLPEWTDHSPNDMGVLLVELFSYMGDVLFYYQDRVANEGYLETAVERQSVINLLRLIGYELRPPTPASADLHLLFPPDAAGTLTIGSGAMFQTTAKATGEPVGFQYVREALDVSLDDLDTVTHTDGKPYKVFATLPVMQVDAAVTGEIVGSSDGSGGQRFRLARTPLIQDQLELRVDEGDGPVLWQRRDSLLQSRPGDMHYVVRREQGDVALLEFGDGRYGKVPQRGRNNITASYRVGGGAKGNVPAQTIVKAVTPIGQLKLVLNEQPATGGADAEASDEAVRRGPQLFKAQDRAVTARDYEAHAKAFGVAKARARAAGWNRIELYVAPVGGGYPTDTLKEDLRGFFESKRIMTSIVEIRDPVYVKVCVGGTLEIDAYHFTEQVQQRVSNAIAQLLAFERVDFEETFYLSKVYEAVEAVEGVRGVYVARLSRQTLPEQVPPEVLPPEGRLRFAWNEIPLAEAVYWSQDSETGMWTWQTWRVGTSC
jgi:hypothetical protein